MKNITSLILLIGFTLSINAQTIDSIQSKPLSKELNEKKTERCPNCNGIGRLVGYAHTCNSCQGTGTKTCKSCRGDGMIYIYQNGQQIMKSCGSCGGMGTRTCYSCGGQGRTKDYSYIPCNRCKSTGYIIVE